MCLFPPCPIFYYPTSIYAYLFTDPTKSFVDNIGRPFFLYSNTRKLRHDTPDHEFKITIR